MVGAAIPKLLVVLCLFRPLIIARALSPHATRASTRHKMKREHGRWAEAAAGNADGSCLRNGIGNHAPGLFGDGAHFLPVSAGHPSPRRNSHVVFMTSNGGDDNNDEQDPDNNSSSEDMLFGEAGLLVALSVVATTLGVATLYSLSTNPLVDFDVDTYLSINRALSLGSSIGGGGVSSDGTMIGGGEIVELPALSPAEQIVGAFFGPPRH